ncbi:CcmD family protein [Asinibacterium sp. OR53]|jgi:hypothetical protein|uniref:CcmD family protein n=1 Tax=Asinibacterium sp. OR53 TaxID=925409 RepID=UPI000428B43C|nr:hypothetical protein [Asinibacterium sp. OR53]
MNKFTRIFLVLTMMMVSVITHAQTTVPNEPNDFMHSNGRIYVVVAVVLTILLGMFVYLFMLDKKISQMEKK